MTVWDAFYEENAAKLAMPKKENYPLNVHALHAWAAAQPEGHPFRTFALSVARNLRYVSYAAFVATLERCIDEVIVTYGTENLCILLTGEEDSFNTPLDKSQTWVALHGYGMLKKRNITVAAVFAGPVDLYMWMTQNQTRPTLLVFDDAAYSGEQLATALNYVWPAKITTPPEANIRYNLSPQTVLVVPYMSRESRVRIRHYNDPDDRYWLIVGIEDLYYVPLELPNFLEATQSIVSEEYNRKLYRLIYFDHKLADNLSVGVLGLAAPVVAYDPASKVTPGERCVPFISNCEEKQCQNANLFDPLTLMYNGPRKKGYKSSIDRCPPAFYKNIRWTLHGKRLYTNDSVYYILTGVNYPRQEDVVPPDTQSSSCHYLGDESKRVPCVVCKAPSYYICKHGTAATSYLCGSACAAIHARLVHGQ